MAKQYIKNININIVKLEDVKNIHVKKKQVYYRPMVVRRTYFQQQQQQKNLFLLTKINILKLCVRL